MYRTMDTDQYDQWDGITAQAVDPHTGKWADYCWVDDDKLLYVDFFDADGEYHGSQISSEWKNPIPLLWSTSKHRKMEIIITDDLTFENR